MAPVHVIPARDEQNIEQKLVTLLLAAVKDRPGAHLSPSFPARRRSAISVAGGTGARRAR